MRHTLGSSLSTSVVTAFVALSPEIATYAGKVFSVFVLAMVAEGGRRFISWLLSKPWRKP